MSPPSRADLRLAAVACGAVSLYDALLFFGAATGLFVIIYRIDLLFPDFMVFHAAGRAVLAGKADIVYDTAALTHLQNTLYADRLPFELGFRPFLYPPLWLLAVLPLGWLPLSAAVSTFHGVSAGRARAAVCSVVASPPLPRAQCGRRSGRPAGHIAVRRRCLGAPAGRGQSRIAGAQRRALKRHKVTPTRHSGGTHER